MTARSISNTKPSSSLSTGTGGGAHSSTNVTGQADGLVIDRARTAKRFQLEIINLHEHVGQAIAFGDGVESVTLDLPGTANVDDVKEAVRNAGQCYLLRFLNQHDELRS